MSKAPPFASRIARVARDLVRFALPQPGPRPYVLAGVAWGRSSAGVKACHRLVHELNEHGMRAYSLDAVNPEWNETQISRVGLRMLRDPVVIYPEVVRGNPLGARHVVRWALNVPGLLGGDARYPASEQVFAWSREYHDTDHILTVDLIEHELFNAENLPPKDVDCFYVGKAETRGVEALPLTDGMTEITRDWPATRAELAALLRRTRTLYTYDDCTSLGWEALLCGCRVVILPENHELTFEDAAREMPDTDHEAQLQRFIKETQEWSAPE